MEHNEMKLVYYGPKANAAWFSWFCFPSRAILDHIRRIFSRAFVYRISRTIAYTQDDYGLLANTSVFINITFLRILFSLTPDSCLYLILGNYYCI